MAKRKTEEQLISLGEAGRSLTRPVSGSTVWRWALRGCRGVRLPIVRQAGRAFTTKSSLAKFLAEADGAYLKPETVAS